MSESIRYEFEEISPVEKKLHVHVSLPHLQDKVEAIYKKLSKDAQLPGFRRGKAPRSLIEKFYKKQMEADVIMDLVDDAVDHLNAQDVRLVGNPRLDKKPEFVANQPLSFALQMETFPTVVVETYEGLQVQKSAAQEITETQVDTELERLRESFVEYKPIENQDVLTENDYVRVALTGTIGNKTYNDEVITIDLTDLDDKYVPAGLAKALLGIPVAAKEHKLAWTIPAAEGSTEETSAQVTATIREAHHKQTPALDDDFAKDTGRADTLSELRQALREELVNKEQERIKTNIQEQLVEELVKANSFVLPPTLVSMVVQDQLENNRYGLAMKAMKRAASPSGLTRELLLQVAEEESRKDLSFQLIARELAEKLQIEITEADVEKYIADVAQKAKVSTARAKAEFQQQDADLLNLRAKLRTQKVLEWVESHANIQSVASS